MLLSQGQRAEDGPSSNLLRRIFGAETVPDGKGLVHVRTDPEGATIIVDGKVVPEDQRTLAGRSRCVLHPPAGGGYKPVHRNIHVQKGKIINLDEILEKQ